MTSAAAAGREPGRFALWMAWVSHFEVRILAVAAGLMVERFIAEVLVGGRIAALDWTTTFVILSALFASLGEFAHMAIFPCDRCTERFPLDAAEEAARKRWALRLMHMPRKRQLVITGALLASMVILTIILPSESALSGLSTLPLLAWWAVTSYSSRKHSKLQPWCPWCRRRDEDDDPIVAPEPTPPSARVDA